MRIISIISSYREAGNTQQLVRCIEDELLISAENQNVNLEFETIFLGHRDVQVCRGCRVCFDKGEKHCPLKDEVLMIRDKIQEADGIILASPVYVEDVNGIMKNWIDRMAFNCHRPAFAGKRAIIIATSGGGASNHTLSTMNNALNAWGFHIVSKGKFRTGALMSSEEIKKRNDHKIRKIADDLFNSLNEETITSPSFYSLMAFKIQQKNWQVTKTKLDSCDFKYWKNNGWLESNCNYYINHSSNPIKVKLARLVGNVISMFFIS